MKHKDESIKIKQEKNDGKISGILEAYDFTGKTIHPFCTHEGSGLGKTEKHIAEAAKEANVTPGLAIKGSDVDNAKEMIERWA